MEEAIHYSAKAEGLFQQDHFLTQLIQEQSLVNIFLINGIKLHGYLTGFDQHALLLKSSNSGGNNLQMIYKHAISTILIHS